MLRDLKRATRKATVKQETTQGEIAVCRFCGNQMRRRRPWLTTHYAGCPILSLQVECGVVKPDFPSRYERATPQAIITCLDCRHFAVRTREPDYSDYTPGEGFTMFCQLHHWMSDEWEDGTDAVRSHLRSARTCPQFQEQDE